jgi:thiosulfate/3-mercaptopyruvate sulfurtransferase
VGRAEALVDADWAEGHLGADGVVFVEVDEQVDAYAVNHLPGAVGLDWRKDLRAPVGRDFVDEEGFAALLSRKGIANDDTIVLYGGDNNWFAAYAYWYFKIYGHRDVRLLDGGRKKWELDGRPLSTDPCNVAPRPTGRWSAIYPYVPSAMRL